MVLQRITLKDPKYHQFRIQEGLLYHDSQIYVPTDDLLRKDHLEAAHDLPITGHLGCDKTLSVLRRTWWWPNMERDVRSFTLSCETCQRNKARTQKV